MTVASPASPPLRATAPTGAPEASAAVPEPHSQPLDINGVAAAIAGSADPAALLTHLLLAVSARSATAPEQGALLAKVADGCSDMQKRVRAALLASVGYAPGNYGSFEVVAYAGARRIDYGRLESEHPEVYSELVTVSDPTLRVRYTKN